MPQLHDLTRINEYEWEIPRDYRGDMRVPVRLFATRRLLEQIIDDRSLEQAVNATTLPGVVGSVVVMPDMHQGYGFPIGGVAVMTSTAVYGSLRPASSLSPPRRTSERWQHFSTSTVPAASARRAPST